LAHIVVGGESLKINRVVIQRGDNRQLVYYWFQQHGRAITNEYLVKLQIFWDAVTRHRTDGAMVRLVAGLLPGEPVEAGDERLERFAAHVAPSLNGFVPD
jgi:EpsI family protein